jgi:tetratricopeptide (TPR) repeat protein
MATGQEVWNWDGTVALGPDCTHIAFLAWNNQIGILEGVPLTPETNVHLEASGLVQFLFGKEPDKHCVLTIIRDTATISEIVRDEALTLAEHWQPSCDASELNSASWSTVRRPDATPDQYQLALQQAEMICGLGPENGLYLNTLGVAQYRVGRYQETIDTLLRADKINGGIPADLAFLAMAQYRLEQKGQAQSTLALLRQAIEKSKQTVDKDTQNFLREAETLIGEPASDSRVKNKDQTTETEDR